MYIANRRDSNKFNGCSPLQIYHGLISLKHAIAYLPYTQRCGEFGEETMKVLLAILIIISTISCDQQKEQTEEYDTEEATIMIDTAAIAIIPLDSTNYWLFKNASPSELNHSDLIQIEQILTNCIDEYNPGQKQEFEELSTKYPDQNFRISDFIIELKEYKRQYVPVINENGEKEIWVNCFCGAMNMDWKKAMVLVNDGGNCYFQMRINLTKGSYFDFMVNGYA